MLKNRGMLSTDARGASVESESLMAVEPTVRPTVINDCDSTDASVASKTVKNMAKSLMWVEVKSLKKNYYF